MSPDYDVTIHAPLAWPLYADPPGPAGGAELQMSQLARSFTRLGLKACHVVFDHPSLPDRFEGVDLVRTPAPGPEHTLPSYTREIFASLRAGNGAVYIQRSAGYETGIVAAYAKSRGRRFILSTSGSGDLALTAPPLPRLSRLSYRLARRIADRIVVQTEDQRRQAVGYVKRPLQVIRSFAEGDYDAGLERTGFLWIGRIEHNKDPLAYVELADRMPEADFWMLGPTHDEASERLMEEVTARAREIANLTLLEPLPRKRALALYQQAVAVVNTSQSEGFPNTFLEGWARGTPALSLRIDPDGVIERHELGIFARGSRQLLLAGAQNLWAHRHECGELRRRTRAYVESAHAPEVVGQQWVELIHDLLGASRSGAQR